MKTEGCGDDGKDKCHASDLEIAINTQKEKKLQYDVDKRMCKAGDLDRCDGFTRDAKQFVADFKNGFSSFIADAYDTCIASPLGGCPPVTNFFPLLSDGAKWKIEHGKDIGLGVSDLVSNKIQVATPQFSPTPYMLSPTVSPTATITLYYTPTVTMTSTSSPTISPTWTSTVGVSPSATSTPTPAYRLQ